MALVQALRPKERAETKTVKKGGRFGEFLKIVGAAAGGIAGAAGGGGPLGAAKGAAAGGAAGQFVGDIFDPARQEKVRVGPADADRQRIPLSGAMQRRTDELTTDPLEALSLAEKEAQTLPEQERQLVLPKLTQARILESRKRGLV